jgi:hypothetical protein
MTQEVRAMTEPIRESRALVVRETGGRTGRLQVGLISPGWGSSGYYSAECLESAGTRGVFAAGTQMFLDHPSESEAFDRPERSVRDLAAVLTEDAVWDGQQLAAEVQVFGPYKDMLTDEAFAKAIGVSIRASAAMESGEAEGRAGRIVTELVEAISVDFVTKAGRGGQILQVLESARDRVVERALAHGVAEATANDTREALQSELTETYGADKTWIWVRDFDDATVWYQLETPDGSATYAEGYTIDDSNLQVTLAGDQAEVAVRTQYVPVPAGESAPNVPNAPQGQPITQEPQESVMPETEEAAGVAPQGTPTDPAAPAAETPAAESGTDSSQEGTMTDTQGAGGTAPTNPRQVMEARIAAQDRQIAEMRAENRARDVVAEVLASGWIGDAQRARLASSLVRSVPLTESFELDEPTLRTRCQEALDAAETEAAEILQAAGVGTPRGLGALTTPASEAATAQTSAKLAESFKAFGLNDAATEIAVKGR